MSIDQQLDTEGFVFPSSEEISKRSEPRRLAEGWYRIVYGNVENKISKSGSFMHVLQWEVLKTPGDVTSIVRGAKGREYIPLPLENTKVDGHRVPDEGKMFSLYEACGFIPARPRYVKGTGEIEYDGETFDQSERQAKNSDRHKRAYAKLGDLMQDPSPFSSREVWAKIRFDAERGFYDIVTRAAELPDDATPVELN